MVFLVIAFTLVGIVLFSQLKPPPASQNQTAAREPFCRATSFTKDSPEVMAPSYIHKGKDKPADQRDEYPTLNQDLKPYKLIKADAPIIAGWIEYNITTPSEIINGLKCPSERSSDGIKHHHFCQWIHDPVVPSPNPGRAKKYAVLYPAPWSRDPGYSSSFNSEDSQGNRIYFADYQLIFLAHLKDDNSLAIYNAKDPKGNDVPFALADVYQQVKYEDNDTARQNPIPNPAGLPNSVLKCKDKDSSSSAKTTLYLDFMNLDSSQKKIQMAGVIPETISVEEDWYYPYCKPVIYLYPKEKTDVSVVLKTKGALTRTDPLYPQSGWNVTAYPNGKIESGDKSYNYLYYESRIKDSDIQKPKEGYVAAFSDLPKFYSQTLPKLGLSQKETEDFKTYWEKALLYSPYYFVGVFKEEEIENIETFTVSPKPSSVIKVRIYFEALDKKKEVKSPEIKTPERKGFTVVEWGGMVKRDKNHPFTCSE